LNQTNHILPFGCSKYPGSIMGLNPKVIISNEALLWLKPGLIKAWHQNILENGMHSTPLIREPLNTMALSIWFSQTDSSSLKDKDVSLIKSIAKITKNREKKKGKKPIIHTEDTSIQTLAQKNFILNWATLFFWCMLAF
jgi:hypothetical protein